jgi:hypothetical protein
MEGAERLGGREVGVNQAMTQMDPDTTRIDGSLTPPARLRLDQGLLGGGREADAASWLSWPAPSSLAGLNQLGCILPGRLPGQVVTGPEVRARNLDVANEEVHSPAEEEGQGAPPLSWGPRPPPLLPTRVRNGGPHRPPAPGVAP